MIKGKKTLFSMIVTGAFMASIMTTPVDAIKNNTVLESTKITTMEVFGATSLNIRSGSGTKYKRIGYAKRGQILDVISISKGWAKISYKGNTAYVSAKYLKTISSQQTNEEMSVKVNVLNVRSGSSTNHKVLGKLNKNDKVKVISILSNGWVKIEYKDGYAYVSNVKGAYLEQVSKLDSSISSTINKIEMITKVKRLNVRTGPSTKYSIMGTLSNGDIVVAMEKFSNGWMKVEYKGQVGYVSNVKDAYLSEGDLVENREKANDIIDLINKLEKNITLNDKLDVSKARIAYDSLNDEAKKLVTNLNKLVNAENKINEILSTVHNVINLINAIPEKVTLEDKEIVQKARNAYDALKDSEKEHIKGATLSILISAELEIDRLEKIESNEDIKNIVSLIESLPNVDDITYEHKNEIMSVLEKYRELPEDLKSAVDLTKLFDAVDKIEIMDAKIIVEEINDLPSVENITVKDKEKIESIRAKYDAISIRNNKRVTNLDVLIAAEKELERSENAVNKVENLINSIPYTSKITLSDKTLIEKVRSEYEALLSKDKSSVDFECYKVLVESEEKIKVLETYSENAKKIEEKIATLNREILYKDYSFIKEIRAEFNALSKEEQKLISNIDILTDAENQMKQILDRVHNVIDLINKIPEKITLEDKEIVQKARNAYDALKDSEKEHIKGATLSILISAELEIDRLETIESNEDIKNIVSLIESLPNVDDITYEHKNEIMSVLEKYRELPEDLKSAVDITKLFDAVDKIEIMDAKIIVEEINNLPSVENITVKDKEKIESIRAKYDAISIRNNKRVTNLNVLIAAEEKLKML